MIPLFCSCFLGYVSDKLIGLEGPIDSGQWKKYHLEVHPSFVAIGPSKTKMDTATQPTLNQLFVYAEYQFRIIDFMVRTM